MTKFTVISVAVFCLLLSGEAMKMSHHKLAMIVGGKEAKEGQFPFAVSIQEKTNRLNHAKSENFCTASLITTKTCIGAAHCLDSFNIEIVHNAPEICGVVGTIDLRNRSSCKEFSDVHVHNEYNLSGIKHDIATYIFEEAVELSDYVKPIPLIRSEEEIHEREIKVIGWGTEHYYEKEKSTILRYASVKILHPDQCKYAKVGIFLCLQTEGKGPCRGDSGGPNVITDSGKEILVGITSITESDDICADRRSLATDIRGYTQWIIDHSDSKPNFKKLEDDNL